LTEAVVVAVKSQPVVTAVEGGWVLAESGPLPIGSMLSLHSWFHRLDALGGFLGGVLGGYGGGGGEIPLWVCGSSLSLRVWYAVQVVPEGDGRELAKAVWRVVDEGVERLG
jgi:hypothetical protein